MTRKEAIEIMQELWRYKEPDIYTETEIRQALDIAIKALEQEPCEDAISRAEAILKIQLHGVGCFDPDEFSPEVCERFVINLISELPSYRLEYESKEPCEDAISRQVQGRK